MCINNINAIIIPIPIAIIAGNLFSFLISTDEDDINVFMLYSLLVSPSSAVTVIIIVLLPSFKSLLPLISISAFSFSASANTSS